MKMGGSEGERHREDLYDKSDRLVVRLSDRTRKPQRWLLVTKEAIAEYWLQNAFVPSTLGIVVLAGLPGKADCKMLETLVGGSRETLMCLTDLSPDGVRTLLVLQGQLRDVRASFVGVSDDMLQAVGFPMDARLKESRSFSIDGPELDDLRLILKENPHLETLLGEYCVDLLRSGRAVDVVALFIESLNERSAAHDRFTALLQHRAPRLAPTSRRGMTITSSK